MLVDTGDREILLEHCNGFTIQVELDLPLDKEGYRFLSFKVQGKVRISKGLCWILRHPVKRKGVGSDRMFQKIENKCRSRDS